MKRVMVVGDLEVAIEEKLNIHIDVAEVCVSVESVDVCWRGKEIRLLKDEEKKDTEKVKRSHADI